MQNVTIAAQGGKSTSVLLPGAAIPTSRVGFGTSLLMARLNEAQSIRLLETALDAGITHFDTARLYGYGEAERALGKILSGRRDKVTVTTKVGILPPKRSPLLSIAKGLARKAAALNPKLRQHFRRKAEGMIQAGAFDLPTMTASFETSLRQLGTDYVDYLLLHECSEADLQRPELLEFLERAKQAGKLRSFGLATFAPVIRAAFEKHPAYTPTVQFPSSIFEPNLEQLRPLLQPDVTVFTHSSLSTGFSQLVTRLSEEPGLRPTWDKQLGVNCADRRVLGKFCLQYALEDYPAGVVLVSSANEQNIRANAATLASPYSAEQISIFAELVRTVAAPQVRT